VTQRKNAAILDRMDFPYYIKNVPEAYPDVSFKKGKSMVFVFLVILVVCLAEFVFLFFTAMRWYRRMELSRTGQEGLHEATLARVANLEKMLDDKARVIAALRKEASGGYVDDARLEELKLLFLAQIKELKDTNRRLKDECRRLSEENTDLQMRLFAGTDRSPLAPVVTRVEPLFSVA
jgi:hypothetical protein